MRAKRAKQYRKLMKTYELSFNFREPYQVLLDAQFIRDAHRFKMHLGKMLENTLSGLIKPMITQCCIRHLYNIKPADDAEQKEKEICIEVAKAAERRRCGHHELEEPLSEVECLKSVVDPKGSGTNKNRYVVASQDRELRASMREIAGVPLIYINRSVMILEPMAEKTEDVREKEERGKIRAGLKTRRGAQPELKRKREDKDDDQNLATEASGASTQAPERKKQKPRGPKAPNPLSVKKAKAKPNSKPAVSEAST
ncbi:Fcf1-domain-containing protein, partial [Neohortaea acidophila]